MNKRVNSEELRITSTAVISLILCGWACYCGRESETVWVVAQALLAVNLCLTAIIFCGMIWGKGCVPLSATILLFWMVVMSLIVPIGFAWFAGYGIAWVYERYFYSGGNRKKEDGK